LVALFSKIVLVTDYYALFAFYTLSRLSKFSSDNHDTYLPFIYVLSFRNRIPINKTQVELHSFNNSFILGLYS